MTIKKTLTLSEREKLWKAEDDALETYCRYDLDPKPQRVVTVEIPDIWKQALSFSSVEDRRSTRRHAASAGKRESKSKSSNDGPAQLTQAQVEELTWYFGVWPSICGVRSSWTEQAEAFDECSKCGTRYPAKSRRTTCPDSACRYPRGSFHTGSYMRVKSGSGSSWHPSYDSEILGIALSGNVEKSRLVRDTLVEMIDKGDSKLVNVLWLVYGDQTPFESHGRFGQLAQLVRFTKAAEKACEGKYDRETLDKALMGTGGETYESNIKQQTGILLSQAAASYQRNR